MNLGIVQQEWVGGLTSLIGDCSFVRSLLIVALIVRIVSSVICSRDL